MKTDHDYGRDKYFYVVIFIIMPLIEIIIYMYVRLGTDTEVRYVCQTLVWQTESGLASGK